LISRLCNDYEEFLFIQPRVNPALGVESLIQLADNGFVLRRVAEENAEFAGFGHVGFPKRGTMVDYTSKSHPLIYNDFTSHQQSVRIPAIKSRKKIGEEK
jgi:hypothetical protein